MNDIRCIGICTGGGDAPGLNAVIRAAVKWCLPEIQLEGRRHPGRLRRSDLAGEILRAHAEACQRDSATRRNYSGNDQTAVILSNTAPVENGHEVTRDISDEVIGNARKLGIDAVISIGGEGSQTIALELFQRGMKIVGVPKTIDNDLSATEVTFGFDTALATATDAVDKIHTTAESHHRIMVVEVMGRDAGWIALEAGIAGGAHVILIPEIPFTIEASAPLSKARELRQAVHDHGGGGRGQAPFGV